MKKLSSIAYQIDGQPMFKTLARVQELERQGRSIIHFELGEPDFDTPENIVDAACRALHNGETHYTTSAGLYEFRDAARHTTKVSRGFEPNIDQVLVTPGANAIIYYTVKCVVNPGDEVIVPDPGFPTYYSAIKACGAVAVRVPLKEENGFRMQPADLRAAITDKTRLIIFNSPSNPTGAANTCAEIHEIAEIAKEKDVYLLSDEIYSRLIFNKERKFCSPSYLDQCKERTIIINGFSKAFAMTGWRLGVAIGPPGVIEKMRLLNETIVSCVPPFIQRAGIEAIVGDATGVNAMREEYTRRRDIITDGLNSLPGVRCTRPDGAIYVFPSITETGMSSDAFSEFAMQNAGVALLPGNNFGPGGEGFVRLSYVNSVDNIEKAIERLAEALREYV
ncbi:MAG: pyridoxal phosphate-dependent aminotransferase [Lentisphaerae bacterium]|nr:pyridoxal phosphate-dependent aminotransferase [Lentisphaerota bacterium]